MVISWEYNRRINIRVAFCDELVDVNEDAGGKRIKLNSKNLYRTNKVYEEYSKIKGRN